ncbi:MAG: hypothetical protein L6R40_005179 [Gallowayella cf. fulva]|nr:MAG: hypothetical protein L6R40_005179 [Xanthomendoza cf. fulva]
MARFLRSKSFSSLTTRPNLFLASSSQPDLPAWPDSSPAPKAASALPSIGRLAIQHASITLISIRAQWNQGLIQHHNFHLHAALTTFKRLIRALRSPTEESSSTITEEYASIDSSPYQILLPEEVALLYINIALIHAYLGSYYLAAAAFEEALLLDEISGIAWFGLGIARFYLKELGASKRAFDKCLACFDAYDTDGGKYRMDELTYHVWSGRPKADCERGGIADMEVSKDAVRDLDPFKDILCSRIPDGRWKLKLVRVDWNWRTVLFERNWVRRGVPRPGDGKWGMCGIPAGVIFALDSDTVGRSTAESHRADEHFDVKHTESVIDNDRIRIRDLKGTRGSLVRRKWADIQHKFLKRKPSTKRPAPLLLSASSSGTIPSPTFLNEQSRFANYHYGGSRTPTRAQAQPHFPELDERLLPLASPLTQHAVGSLDDEDPDEEEIRLMIDRHEKIASGATWAFPTRQSSLSVPMKIPPRRRSRSQRLSINTVVHDVEDTIENDYSKEEKGKLVVVTMGHTHADVLTKKEDNNGNMTATPKHQIATSPHKTHRTVSGRSTPAWERRSQLQISQRTSSPSPILAAPAQRAPQRRRRRQRNTATTPS